MFGCMLVSGWFIGCVLSWIKRALEKLELNDTQKLLLYRDCDLMDENVSVMNKYSELCSVAVSRFVCRAEQTV